MRETMKKLTPDQEAAFEAALGIYADDMLACGDACMAEQASVWKDIAVNRYADDIERNAAKLDAFPDPTRAEALLSLASFHVNLTAEEYQAALERMQEAEAEEARAAA